MVASNSSGSTSGKSQLRVSSGGGISGQGGLKKGPWSSSEDAILIEYVRKHGEGNWNAVQRNTGLLRCGKSCRLRWANHLRPNLKKGSFSSDEERLIIELHAKIGNKWARMASQLPGRTDNEIKNYWNTRVKRLQRAGLPIYPHDIQQQDHHHHHHHQPQQQQRHHHPTSSFSSSLLSPPSRYSNPKFNPLINFPTIQNPFLSYPNNPQHLIKTFHNINGSTSNTSTNFALPLSTSPILFNQRLKSDRELLLAYPLQFKSSGFDISSTPTMGGSFGWTGLAPARRDTELPSIQSSVPEMMTTQTSSGTSGGGGGDYVRSDAANSGLLEALLEQSKALVNTEKDKERSFAVGNGKEKLLMEDDDEIYGLQDSFSQSSAGMKEKDPLEEMNDLIDDDLSSLLNNFPMTTPLPDWYDASTANASSIGQSWSWSKNEGNSGLNSNSADIDIASQYSPVASTWVTANYPKPANAGSSCWNIMPRIC